MKFNLIILFLVFFLMGNAQTIRPSVNSIVMPAIKSSIEARNMYKYSGTKFILTETTNGLHCNWLEDGSEIWHFVVAQDGITPAVDQENGWIYYQTTSRLWKIDAKTGTQLDFTANPSPLKAVSSSTLLVNDDNGYYVVTIWYYTGAYQGTIKAYNSDLDIIWTVTGLNMSYKNLLTYHDGLVYVGTGEVFGYPANCDPYEDTLEMCRVIAYDITDGSQEWVYEVDDTAHFQCLGRGIMQVIYTNGYIIAETQGGGDDPVQNYQIFVLNAETGELVKSYTSEDGSASSCGIPCFTAGKLITGDLVSNEFIVTKIGTGDIVDFAPFGTAQINTMAVSDSALKTLDETITHEDNILSGNNPQGCVVVNGIAYLSKSSNVFAINPTTLELIRTYSTSGLWDSSPLVVQNRAGEWLILAHEYSEQRTICRKVSDGSLLWYATGQPGNLFFGFSYYEYP